MSSFLSSLVTWGGRLFSELPSSFNFTVGPEVSTGSWSCLYQLFEGNRKSDGLEVSILFFDKSKHCNENEIRWARNMLQKIKTLRQPYILKIYETLDTNIGLYIVSEKMTPYVISKSFSDPVWGIKGIAEALQFLHSKCGISYGCLDKSNIFVTTSGDWKLGMFDFARPLEDDPYALRDDLKKHVSFPRDFSSAFQCAGRLPTLAEVDRRLFVYFCKDVATSTPSLNSFCQECLVYSKELNLIIPKHKYFTQNEIYNTLTFLDNLPLKSVIEKEEFFSSFPIRMNSIQKKAQGALVVHRLLQQFDVQEPALLLLTAIFVIHDSIEASTWTSNVLPVLINQFSSPDRSIRHCLLRHLPLYERFLSEQDACAIFDPISYGFTDSSHVLRESTLFGTSLLMAKFVSKKSIADRCVRLMARLSQDSQPHIRANLAICFAQIIPHLAPEKVSQVGLQTLITLLKDSQSKVRYTALDSCSRVISNLLLVDICQRLIPVLGLSLLDPDTRIKRKVLLLVQSIVNLQTSSLPEEEADPAPVVAESVSQPPDSFVENLVEEDEQWKVDELIAEVVKQGWDEHSEDFDNMPTWDPSFDFDLDAILEEAEGSNVGKDSQVAAFSQKKENSSVKEAALGGSQVSTKQPSHQSAQKQQHSHHSVQVVPKLHSHRTAPKPPSKVYNQNRAKTSEPEIEEKPVKPVEAPPPFKAVQTISPNKPNAPPRVKASPAVSAQKAKLESVWDSLGDSDNEDAS